MNKSILILILSILAVTKVAAQDAFVFYQGKTQAYKVENHSGSEYEWKIYDQLTPLTETDADNYESVTPTNLNTLVVKWKITGTYYLVVREEDAGGCTNTKAVRLKVIPNADKFLITNTSSAQCYSSSLENVTVNLSFLDENDVALSADDFPITVSYTLNGVAQTPQSVSFENQTITIPGSALTSNPVADTGNTIVIIGATYSSNLTIQPLTGQDKHTHTILKDIIAPTVTNLITRLSTPEITGTVSLRSNESLSVSVKGHEYTVGDGYLSISGNDWSLNIPWTYRLSVGETPVVAKVTSSICGTSVTATGTVNLDVTRPSVDIQGEPEWVSNTNSYQVKIKFSETITGFELGDITVGNGTASDLALDTSDTEGLTYVVRITPDGNGNITLDIAEGVVMDLAGNINIAASQAVTIYDVTPPTVEILGAPKYENAIVPYTVTFKFSEKVTGFDANDITITGGTFSNFAGSDDTYTALITPDGDKDVLIRVAQHSVYDITGLTNEHPAEATTLWDNTRPTVQIQGAPAYTNNKQTYSVTFRFSEAVSGFEATDVVVANGTLSNFAKTDDATYTADITPTGAGDITINIAEAVAKDIADNDNIAATQATTIFDETAPAVPTVNQLITDDTTPVITGTAVVGSGETLTVVLNGITYSAGDGHLSLSGSDWSLQIPTGNELGNGLYDVIATITDAAGNSSSDTSSDELKTRPLPTLSLVSTECSVDYTTYTITFSSDGMVSSSPVFAVVGNQIPNIPAGTDVVLTASSEGLVTTLTVSAPNCNCPVITAPVSGADQQVCAGSTNPSLTATVNSGETVDWYASPTGGTALKSGDLTYQPTETAPGSYTYYAEARNTTSGCTSTTRSAVHLTIYAVPSASLSVGDDTVCAGTSGMITLLSSESGVTYQLRLDSDDTPVGSAQTGTGNDLNFTVSPTTTTTYNILATGNGNCSVELIDKAVVTVNENAVGGIITGGGSVVAGTNTKTLTLSGYVGTIVKWQQSTNGGVSWIDIANTEASLTITNLSQTTVYRAVIINGSCSEVNSQTATITVTDNQSPVAVDDHISTNEGASVTGNMLANDSDPEGGLLTILLVGGSSSASVDAVGVYGTLDWSENGAFVYTPNAAMDTLDINESVHDDFDYTITDADGNQSSATISVTINGLQNTVSVTITPFCNHNLPYINYSVTTNFTVDPNSLSITWIDSQSRIVSTDSGLSFSGNLLWAGAEADASENATDWPGWINQSNHWVQGNDGFELITSQAKIKFSVNPNQSYTVDYPSSTTSCSPVPPMKAVGDIQRTIQGQPITIPVLSNDSGIPSGALLSTMNENSNAGTLVVNANGTITYTPAADFVGTYQFGYRVCDPVNTSRCEEAAVSVTVATPNNAPVALDDSYNTPDGQVISGNVATNDYDPDGDVLVYSSTLLLNPTKGMVIFNSNGTFIYTPYAGAEGTDYFTYQVCDYNAQGNLCASANVYITFTTNNAPIATNDAFVTKKNTQLTGSMSQNDSDPDADHLIYDTPPVVDCQNGTVVINADGTFTYTPSSDFTGTDSFTYQVCDDGTPVKCATAQVVISVEKPDNHYPVAVNDINNTFAGTPVSGNVLTNDYDVDGDEIIVITPLISEPSNGTVKINKDGSYTYTPADGFDGEDFFRYVIAEVGTDPVLSDTAVVTIEVWPAVQGNKAPIANEDQVVTLMNTSVSGNVLLNDFDPDMDDITLTKIVSEVKHGKLEFDSDGSFTYTPEDAYWGTDHFTYEVCDNAESPLCAQATVTIKIKEPDEENNAPFAADDAVFTIGDPISSDVSANDYDPDGDKLTYTLSVPPSNGTVVLNEDGTYTYTPGVNWSEGSDQFVYQVCDDGIPSKCSKATVYITMLINHQPLAVDDDLFCLPNEIKTGNVLKNDSDPDNDDLTVNTVPVSGPFNGSLSLSADGAFVYTPKLDFEGEDRIVYEVCDNGEPVKCAQATLLITVKDTLPADRLATNDINTTIQNQPVTGNVLTNDDGYADANSTVTLYEKPIHGSVEITTNGDYTYTPATDYTGEDRFLYIVCTEDEPADCDTVNVSITIIPSEIKNGPVANDDATETTMGNTVTSNLLANDYSPSGEQLQLNLIPLSNPEHGMVTINADGQYKYTPDAGFIGTDLFTYEVCGLFTEVCASATVRITVNYSKNNRIFAADDAVFTYGTTVTGNVLENDVYSSASLKLNQTPLTSPSNGALSIAADGTFTYTPNSGFEGVDRFVYQICDVSTNICDDATVLITVLPAPVVAADLSITKMSTPIVREQEEIYYIIEVSNLGASVAQNVRIADFIPGFILNPEYARGSSASYQSWSRILNIGNLSADETVKIHIRGTVAENAPDTILNYASVASDTWDPNYDNNISVAKSVVNRNPKIVIADGNPVLLGYCNTEGVILDASESTGKTALQYHWSPSVYLDDPNSAAPHFTPGKSTDYTLTVTDQNGLSSEETVSVQIIDSPDAVTDQHVFVNAPTATLILDGSESTGQNISYRWWTNDGIILSGETNSRAQVSGLGKYYLEVTDLFGCTDVDSLIVGQYVQAVNDTVETDLNTSIDINVVSNDIPQGEIDPSSITIQSQPEHGIAMVVSDSIIAYTPNNYYAGTDDFTYMICDYFLNCDEANVLVIVNDEELFIPDAFSPNGDGVNDYFEVKGISKYSKVYVEIVNRWGNRVYSSSNYGLGDGKDGFWDGTANTGVRLGQGPVSSGTYYYVMQFDNGEKLSGSIYVDR